VAEPASEGVFTDDDRTPGAGDVRGMILQLGVRTREVTPRQNYDEGDRRVRLTENGGYRGPPAANTGYGEPVGGGGRTHLNQRGGGLEEGLIARGSSGLSTTAEAS
jgi:hypothetical protein